MQTPSSGWSAALARVRAWWDERPPRDRQILMACFVLVMALVVVAWLWLPAVRGIRALERDLPLLRAQRAEVLALAQEGRSLRELARQNGVNLPAAGARRAVLQRSFESAGLRGVELMDEGPNRLRLRWARVDYGVWAAWAAAVVRDSGARFAQVNVDAALAPSVAAAAPGAAPAAASGSLPGQVRVEAVLEWRVP
jgi:general secretion pathway protein M